MELKNNKQKKKQQKKHVISDEYKKKAKCRQQIMVPITAAWSEKPLGVFTRV